MIEDKKTVKIPHNLILENRKNLNVSGVKDVDKFDEENITLITEMGELSIKGIHLHINKFSVENGELNVEGDISSLSYSEINQNQGGFFSKLFR